ncbi:glucoside xylosyltransferase 2-like [Oratosquilla oratoria]|uniref:glucoside xylosyltransferase 2-like n=1 Tax=Oratosquilla oratoria TaxID=337810 RepID=UPI003F76785C
MQRRKKFIFVLLVSFILLKVLIFVGPTNYGILKNMRNDTDILHNQNLLNGHKQYNQTLVHDYVEKEEGLAPPLVMVLCRGKDKDETLIQFAQIKAMLNSVAWLSSGPLQVHVITDTPEIFSVLLHLTRHWPEVHRSRINFTRHSTWFPSSHAHLKDLYHSCAAQKLFLPTILDSVESAVYVDTDVIFLRPPEHLSPVLGSLGGDEVLGLVHEPYPWIYHKVPLYPKGCLNDGVMFINLTKAREFPGGWERTLLRYYEKYKAVISTDQDILNVLLRDHPEYVRVLTPEWNYGYWQCATGIGGICQTCLSDGIALLHGYNSYFVNAQEDAFEFIFKTFLKLDVRSSVKDVASNLTSLLNRVLDEKMYSPCVEQLNENFADMVLMYLRTVAATQ